MSVIPLTTNGQNPTVVTSKDKFSRDGEAILIQELDKDQLGPDSKGCNICYDLRVGPRFRDHRSTMDEGGKELRKGEAINLVPGMAVIIETEEEVRFPKTAFGQIVPKISMLQDGVSNTPSKVDPGYEGPLLITVFNHGKQSIPLRRHQRFCSFYAMTVAEGIRPYDGSSKVIKGRGTGHPWQSLRDFLEANNGAASTLLIIATLVLYILFIYDKIVQ